MREIQSLVERNGVAKAFRNGKIWTVSFANGLVVKGNSLMEVVEKAEMASS